ncbi:MAG: chlorophyll synthase ChlG [Alphaproteobacteria bacterium]
MLHTSDTSPRAWTRHTPEPRAVLTLLKPITWFPPIWAFLCGLVSSGGTVFEHGHEILVGLILVGPLVCGMSQAANDWCDRHVDQINEPHRPIPSGRIPGKWGLWIAISMSIAALGLAASAGVWVLVPTVIAVLSAWAYSCEPVRLKRSGIWGPLLVGLSYETLPWLTGVAIMSAQAPSITHMIMATLYGLGAFGIMTLNDFKALEGDRKTGVQSLPVMLGPDKAALVACGVILIAQVTVMLLLFGWGHHIIGIIIIALLAPQIWAMRLLLKDPKGKAPWFNGPGVIPYILGMMVTAWALSDMTGGF